MDWTVSPFTFVSVPLFIISAASTSFLLNTRRKPPATRYLIGALIMYTLATAAVFATGIRFWGRIFWALQEALMTMAAVAIIQFVEHYREHPNGHDRLTTFVNVVSVALGASSFVCCAMHLIELCMLGGQGLPAAGARRLLLPAAHTAALAVSVHSTIAAHRITYLMQNHRSGIVSALSTTWHPEGHNARVLRNISVAIVFGLAYGTTITLTALGYLEWPVGTYVASLTLLMTVAIIAQSALIAVDVPAGIEVKLVSLVLTFSLCALAVAGLVSLMGSILRQVDELYGQTAAIQQAIEERRTPGIASDLTYIVRWSADHNTNIASYPDIVTLRKTDDADAPSETHLSRMTLVGSPIPAHGLYTTEGAYQNPGEDWPDYRAVLRYANSNPGSFHTHVGLQFTEGNYLYEVGYSLSEVERPTRHLGTILIALTLSSSSLIAGLSARIIHIHVTAPLGNLLDGMIQANSGSYDVVVPVTSSDTVGSLTKSFNQLTSSIATEIHERRAAEAQVRALNAGLEIQVASRTRELAALYDIAGIAGQALSQEELLNESLARVVAALSSEAGSVYLTDESNITGAGSDSQEQLALVCVSQAGRRHLPLVGNTLSAHHALTLKARQQAPWLIRDVTNSHATAGFDLYHRPAAMLCLPLAVEEAFLGLVLVLASPEHIFDLDEIALGASMADQIATGLHATQLRERTTLLEERERIAGDLHDSAIQALYGLVTLTSAALLQLDQDDHPAARHTLSRIGETGRQAIREIRLFIYNLNPPALEAEGLIGALHQRLATVEGRANIEARLLADDTLNLPLRTQRFLYQIAQEALNNALKHAHATQVTVYLSTEGDVTVLEIRDDGIGFDVNDLTANSRGGMGLRNMRRRSLAIGANLHIMSQPGHGTRIRVAWSPKQQPV